MGGEPRVGYRSRVIDAPGRGTRALRAAATGLAAGGAVGLLDALRARLEPGSVLPPADSPLVVLLYAAAWMPAALLAGLLFAEGTAAAIAWAGAAALAAGLAANHYLLPAFTDPVSLAGDGGILLLAMAGGWILRRRFAARGVPGPRAAVAVGGGALALSLLLAMTGGRDDGPAPSARAGPGTPPDILLVVVDTLRADAVGFSRAAGAAPTPAMDALAAEGTVFTTCRASSSWTKPSTASLLTGLYPSEHGALSFEAAVPGEATTLPEILRAAGWRTAAFTDNPFVSPEFGFAQGFDSFEGRHPSPLGRGTLLLKAVGQVRLRLAGGAAYSFGPGVDLGDDRLLADVVSFLAAGGGRPGFAYVHLIEPHFPYTPPPPFDGGRRRIDPPHSSGILPFDSFPDIPAADAAAMRANYDGEVRGVDAALGRALDALRKAGRLDGTLVVLTSDHGEEFHEHGGWTHGQSLYEELVRVPLLVRAPAGGPGAGRRVERAVSGVDLAPTVLELAGVASSAAHSGRSLVPLMEGKTLDPRATYAEIEAGPVGARAVFLGNHALIVARKSGRRAEGIYDLAKDPGEFRNLLEPGAAPGIEKALRQWMARGFADMEAGALRREERCFDADTLRDLAGIGYTGK